MFVDNEFAITFVINQKLYNHGAKHIEIRFHFIRDVAKKTKITVSSKLLTNLFTKPLAKDTYEWYAVADPEIFS